ncbi:MAG: AAA family ATPase, partial [candidate division KSB1 bacterium]
ASDWKQAERELLQALAQRQQSGLNVEAYGLRFVDYLPHYWLGVTYFNLGDFENAARQFELARAEGVIQKVEQFNSLRQYEQILKSITQSQQAGTSLQAQQKSSTPKQEHGVEFENALQRNDFAEAQRLLLLMEATPAAAANLPALKMLLQRVLEARALLETSAPTALPQKFEAGLAQYVAGNYAAALRLFVEIEAQDPAFRQVSNWRNQTQAVMARLQLPPETITILDTITSTSLPVIAFASPSGNRSETRADSILISGAASDDLGIRLVEFTLNGKPNLNARGERLIFAPRNTNEALNQPFAITLPLRLGENQIVVTAYDNDPTPHQSTYYKTVLRLRPWYQTPAFYLTASALLLLSAGSFTASVFIKRRIAFVNRYNPYIAGAPVRNEKMFYGREKLLVRLLNTLPNNSLMLHGPRRIGKTSLLHQLQTRLARGGHPEYHYVPVFIDLQGVREERLFLTLRQDIHEACRPMLGDLFRHEAPPREYSARDFSADLKQVLAHLQTLTAKKLKLVLLLDEVDTLNSYSERVNQQLRGIFMKSFAENLVAVLSGSYIRKQWESEGSPWYNFFEEIAVPPLPAEEARALIRGPVAGIFSYEPEALEQILALSKCEPYRIQRLCVNVINRLIEMKRRRVTAQDVQAVHEEIFKHETKS